MNHEPRSIFQQTVERATTDPEVIAAFLTGSRGKGFASSHSDYGLYLVCDGTPPAERYQSGPGLDLKTVSWADFASYADWGTPEAWDRYDFLHVVILFDRSSQLAPLLYEKSMVPETERPSFISASLDAYVNALYRSLKCYCRQERLGQKLEAANSLPPLLNAIFALQGRPCPFPGYLRQELEHYPLELLPTDASTFCAALEAVLSPGEASAQQDLFRICEPLIRSQGYGQVLDDWQELDWIKTFSKAD